MRTTTLSLAVTATLATPAAAAGIDVTVTIPQLKVAEYHRPYVAMWIEQPGQPTATTISVWYDDDMKANEGTKWLRDVRTWWRKSGRSMKFPAAGVSGATRAPGPQKISFVAGKGGMPNLAPGNYVLMIEAAREVGGREMLQLPFAWPPKPGQTVRAAGKAELGQVVATFKP
ncbi:hypothetical protein KC8_10445 [Sphingomonas sp. KC8]|nr:hypothetical protein KC8_10445 [Sphingomonas sp. KC8]